MCLLNPWVEGELDLTSTLALTISRPRVATVGA